MKYIVVYTFNYDVVHTEIVPSGIEHNKNLLDKYLENNAMMAMAEYEEDSCKIAVIDFETNATFTSQFEREITVKISRTDY